MITDYVDRCCMNSVAAIFDAKPCHKKDQLIVESIYMIQLSEM